jgi:hypothetical protein
MAGMKNCNGQPARHRLLEKPVLDGGLPEAVVAKRLPRLVLSGGDDGTVPMDPDRSAVQQVAYATVESLRQLFGALLRVTCKVDDGIGSQFSYVSSKGAGLFFRNPVEPEIVN